MKAVTAAQMRAIEQRAVESGLSLDTLMENAGLAVADAVSARLGKTYGRRVLVLAGPGNNGSDGFVAARHLARRGAQVTVFTLADRRTPDDKRALAEEAGVRVFPVHEGAGGENADTLRSEAAIADMVIDAVLGTGRARPVGPHMADVFSIASESHTTVIAVDLPTGLDPDTGTMDPNGMAAHVTLMLGRPKIGPLVAAANGVCGEIEVLDIGLPGGIDADVDTEQLTDGLARQLLPPRPLGANKGTFGSCLVVGGSPDYIGAPMLATRSALRSGAGLVYVALPGPVYRLVAGSIDEAIYISLAAGNSGDLDAGKAATQVIDAAQHADSVLIGPGMGQSPAAIQLVESIVRNLPPGLPSVFDADALNIISRMPGLLDREPGRDPLPVLTPHPGEMARLLKSSVAEVQADRLSTALHAARTLDACIVLKGAATIIATPDGQARISPWINPGLAKGGTGDVLAGLIAGILAQVPSDPYAAASLGVYIHGLAGEQARNSVGERGMTAGDVAFRIPGAYLALDS